MKNKPKIIYFKTAVKRFKKKNCLNRTKTKDIEQSVKVNFKLIIICSFKKLKLNILRNMMT